MLTVMALLVTAIAVYLTFEDKLIAEQIRRQAAEERAERAEALAAARAPNVGLWGDIYEAFPLEADRRSIT